MEHDFNKKCLSIPTVSKLHVRLQNADVQSMEQIVSYACTTAIKPMSIEP